MNRRLERVNVASLRVALISTGIVAVVYAIIAVAIVMVVTSNLTSQVDARLASSLARYERSPFPPRPASVNDNGQSGLSAPLLVWLIPPPGAEVSTQETNIDELIAPARQRSQRHGTDHDEPEGGRRPYRRGLRWGRAGASSSGTTSIRSRRPGRHSS